MKKTTQYLLCAALMGTAFIGTSDAQSPQLFNSGKQIQSQSWCRAQEVTERYIQEQLQLNPSYGQLRTINNSAALQINPIHKAQSTKHKAPATNHQNAAKKFVVRIIPVVVHVVYNTGAENISDAAINGMITTMTEDYRRQNPNASNTRAQFLGVAADTEIEFCLASKDPSGASTTGITRTSTSEVSFDPNTETNDMKDDATGGKTGWNAYDYLNIWICNIAGNTGGYAYYPTFGMVGSWRDGLVVDYQTVGYGGRTATHELGHYFNISHIWGSSQSCASDDGFTDTPTSDGPNYFCNFSNASCSSTDMIENFMDYTPSSCQNMFTIQQAAEMNSILSGVRSSLLSSTGCEPTAPPVTDFTAQPITVVIGGIVNFTDISTGIPDTWSWNFGGGGTPNTQTVKNPSITFNTLGTYDVSLTASNFLGSDIETKVAYVNVIPLPPCGITGGIFCEDFEGVVPPALPAGWATNSLSSDAFYTGDNAAANVCNAWPIGTHTIFAMTNDDACTTGSPCAGGCNKSADYLEFPTLDFTGFSSIRLSFEYIDDRTYGGNPSTVELNINGGGWNVLYTMPQTGTDPWENANIALTGTDNQPNIRIRFHYDDGGAWGTGLAVDDILVYEPPPYDAVVIDVKSEYTIIPVKHKNPLPLEATITNQGKNTVTNVELTVNVYDGSLNNIFTGTSSTVPTLTVSANTVLTIAGGYTPPDTGFYLHEYIAAISEFDGNTSNDTMYASIYISDTTYARDDGSATSLLGIADSNTAILGQTFTLQTSDYLNTILAFVLRPVIGDTTRLVVYNMVGGLPSTLIGATNEYIFTAADTPVVVLTLPMSGGPLALSAGTYFVGIEDYWSTNSIGIATTPNIYTPGVTFARINGAPFDSLENFGSFQRAFIIRPNLAYCNLSLPTSIVDANCGLCDGSATVTPSGGVGSYTYSWNTTPPQTAPTANNLCAGTYQVVVTDASGCSGGVAVTISDGASMALTMSTTDASCGSANGTATVTVTGGTGSYTYLWDAAAGNQIAQTATGLAAGSYNVTITDANGCTVSTDLFSLAVINDPGTPAAPTAGTNATYCDGDLIADLTATGTNIEWFSDAGLTTLIGTGSLFAITPGIGTTIYYVTQTVSGCQGPSSTVAITVNPMPIIDTESKTDPSACGVNDGTITITASGGTSPLQYSIDGGVTFSGSGNFTGLGTGNYAVVVTDVNGCTVTGSTLNIVDLGAPPAPTAGTDATYCDGDAVAGLTATGTGIEWFSDAGLTNLIGTGSPFAITPSVGTTTYYVTQTVSGCQSPASSVVITVNAMPSAPTAGTNATYCDGDAIAGLTATGTGIEWFSDAGLTNLIGTGSPFAITPSVGTATTYYVTQTDSGCQSTASTVTITVNPVPIIDTESKIDATTCTSNDGTITITASGGTPPLLYSIDNGTTFFSSGNFTALSNGSYPVVISDANGCEKTGSILIITSDDAPPAPTAGTNATYCQGDTIADLTATAGSGGTLTWYDDPGLTNVVDTGTTLTPDTTTGTTTYYVTETVSGCESPPSSVVITIGCTGIIETILASAIRLYPNPTTGTITLEFTLDRPKDINITVMNILGEVVSTADVDNVTSKIYTIDLSGRANGVYFIRILTDEEVIVKKISLVK